MSKKCCTEGSPFEGLLKQAVEQEGSFLLGDTFGKSNPSADSPQHPSIRFVRADNSKVVGENFAQPSVHCIITNVVTKEQLENLVEYMNQTKVVSRAGGSHDSYVKACCQADMLKGQKHHF